jgi:phosphoserine aminotransferase
MISFYPGPSQVRAQMPEYFAEAYSQGILSQNHRSSRFEQLLRQTEALLIEKLNLPEGYRIFLVSSATEIWEILTQSFPDLPAVHIFNGAFGKKWFDYAHFIKADSQAVRFAIQEPLPEVGFSPIFCLTHNETSNGTALSDLTLQAFKVQHPESLIFVDAVSSMAGVELVWDCADVWFASVQKCFGLPAGLAVGVVSPKALKIAALQRENKHYNSLLSIMANMDKYQTTHTPNVLGIYFLFRVLQDMENMALVHQKTVQRAAFWRQTLSSKGYELLCRDVDLQSQTVFCVKSRELEALEARCNAAGIELGKGYGEYKKSTFRIANFPSLSEQQCKSLADLL